MLLTVLQRQSQERLILERKFLKDFRKLVKEYKEEVLNTYTSQAEKGVPNYTISVMLRIANQDFKEKYQKLLYKHLLLVEKNARNQTDELIKLQQKKRLGQKQEQISFKELPLTWISTKAQTLLAPINKKPYVIRENKPVKQYLKNLSINSSQKTAERIDRDINKILTESETQGTNSRGVAKLLTKKYKQLETWEAERIARTEINAANNLVSHQRLLESGLVDYKQWVSAEDGRVRTSHKHLNGEIARIGEPFSNGLQYPGDHNGRVEEFINCRCTLVPYIPDYDKIAPNKSTFRESEMQRLPTSKGQQITLQLQENMKLYEVMEGYMKLYPDSITIKPSKIQTTLDSFRGNKYKLDDLLQPVTTTPKIKMQTEETIHSLTTEADQLLNKYQKLQQKEQDIFKAKLNVPNLKMPMDTQIRKLKADLEQTKNTGKFNVKNLSPEKQQEWKKLSDQLLDELQNGSVNSNAFKRYKSQIKVFLKKNQVEASGKFNINALTKEEQKTYKELLQKQKEDKLGLIGKLDLRELKEKAYIDPDVLKKQQQINSQIKKLEKEREELIEKIEKQFDKSKQQIRQESSKVYDELAILDEKIGKMHIKQGTKPSTIVTPTSTITKVGLTFNRYDGIEKKDKEYHELSRVHNAQESRKTYGTTEYTEGSGHFNSYIKCKTNNDTKGMEHNVLNALIHPKSIYRLNQNTERTRKILKDVDTKKLAEKVGLYDEDILLGINKTENPELYQKAQKRIKQAEAKLKKLVDAGDKDATKAYTSLKKSFEKEEKDLRKEAIPLHENIVTMSGQNYDKFKDLKVGDDYIAETNISTSLSREQTEFFIKRAEKKCVVYFYNKEGTPIVFIGERSSGAKSEAEIIQMVGTKGKVIGLRKELHMEGTVFEEEIPALDIMIG